MIGQLLLEILKIRRGLARDRLKHLKEVFTELQDNLVYSQLSKIGELPSPVKLNHEEVKLSYVS